MPRRRQRRGPPSGGYYLVTEEPPAGGERFLLAPEGVVLPPGPQPPPPPPGPMTPALQDFIDRVIVPNLLDRLYRQQREAAAEAVSATPDDEPSQGDEPPP